MLGGDCFTRMELELRRMLELARNAAAAENGSIVLPTLEKQHLTLDYMTPSPRYLAMNRLLTEMRGGKFERASTSSTRTTRT